MTELSSMIGPAPAYDPTTSDDFHCPSCGGGDVSIFYKVDAVPVHSCLLMPTKEDALLLSTANIELGFCKGCGFIFNTLFNAAQLSYSTSYEETQGFSPRFNSFLEALARKLIDKYGIRKKNILEIGCGKGEFLVQMCQLGDNRGTGIDPSYVPQRTCPEAAARVTFIQDFYSEKYAHLNADVICCRHTLEHIRPTRQFLNVLRRSIGRRRDTLVFFEVPDVVRILEEGAFWDIYYEHCSYFSCGSLARLFRSSGFDLMELYLDYDDQYIMLVARPADSPGEGGGDLENDLGDICDAVRRFTDFGIDRIDKWRKDIRQRTVKGEKVVIWGAGSKAVAFLTTLKIHNEIEYIVDVNPFKTSTHTPGTGHKIISPKFLASYKPEHVIVMNPIYCEEIARDLDRLGVQAQLLPV